MRIKIARWLDRNKLSLKKKAFGLRLTPEGEKPKSKFFSSPGDRETWLKEYVKDLKDKQIEVSGDLRSPQVRKRSLSWAITHYLASNRKKGLRRDTIRTREQRLGALLEFLGDMPLAKLERKHVISFIETGGCNTVRQNRCSDCVTFLNWCGNEDQGRDWIPPFKFTKLSWEKLAEDEKQIGILTPEDAEDLLDDILPKYQAGYALALFAGIRPMGELSKLRWDAINFDRRRIVIDSSITKTRKRRVLSDLPENLWAWLEAVPESEREGGVIHSYAGFSQARCRACKRLKIDYPDDAARHSFASYGYWKGEEWARRVMGHTQTSEIFHKHYVDAGPVKEDSESYFGIFPKKNPTPA